jgi:hypothetical protein
VSAVYSARSGIPFSLINSTFDENRNGFISDDYLPAGTYSGTGEDAYTVEYKGGRNGARGPNYQRLDFRAGYRIRLAGGRTIDAFLDMFNLTNEPNFASPIHTNTGTASDRRQPTFLQIVAVSDESPTRTAQINLRFGF